MTPSEVDELLGRTEQPRRTDTNDERRRALERLEMAAHRVNFYAWDHERTAPLPPLLASAVAALRKALEELERTKGGA
ncbi:MAG: hypothetical protein ACK4N5_22480 [Myxococcales bacterium]